MCRKFIVAVIATKIMSRLMNENHGKLRAININRNYVEHNFSGYYREIYGSVELETTKKRIRNANGCVVSTKGLSRYVTRISIKQIMT